MATLGTSNPTLLDWAKTRDPQGRTADIVSILAQTNEILTDATSIEGNLPTGHRVSQSASLPTPTWRQFNAGVTPTKGTFIQYDEQCAMLEAYCNIDVDLAKLNGDTADFRMTQATVHLEGMAQEMAGTLFYGNSGTSPEEFTGLTPRYNSLSATTGQNIINAGAGSDTDLTSIWLVGWSPTTISTIFPKGSSAGLMHEDLGEQLVQTALGVGGGSMKAYVDHFQWKMGLAVMDWRYAVRICNIDNSELSADGAGSSVKLLELMMRAIHRIPTNKARLAFYANRTVKEMLDIQAMNKSNLLLNVGEEEGRLKTTFRGIPVRTCDVLEGETVVS